MIATAPSTISVWPRNSSTSDRISSSEPVTMMWSGMPFTVTARSITRILMLNGSVSTADFELVASNGPGSGPSTMPT